MRQAELNRMTTHERRRLWLAGVIGLVLPVLGKPAYLLPLPFPPWGSFVLVVLAYLSLLTSLGCPLVSYRQVTRIATVATLALGILGSTLRAWVDPDEFRSLFSPEALPFAVLVLVIWWTITLAVLNGLVYLRLRLWPVSLGHPYCHCGYNLTGNVSGVCPECGTEINKP